MKKGIVFLLIVVMVALLFPSEAFAASADFIISGPDTLQTNQTGTYKVKVKVSDAAAAQATLEFDSSFFQLVEGSVKGEWDSGSNKSDTIELISVKLKCIGAVGSKGSLSLSGKKVSRLTGGDPPSEEVRCSGGSKTVSNPVPEPTVAPTIAPTRTPAPSPRHTANSHASATPAATPTPTPTPTPTATVAPTPTATPDAWEAVKQDISAAAEGSTVDAQLADTKLPPEVLALLKEKKCVLAADLGSYACAVDGRDIYGAGGEALDLGVSMEKDETLSAAAGGRDIFQLHFSHAGEMPGKVSYTFKAEGCSPGDILYLYCYYAQSGITEYMQRATVDADGNVTFVIYHGSGYFAANAPLDTAVNAMIADEPTAQAGAPQAAPGVSALVLILSVAGALLAGGAAVWFAEWAIRRKKAGDGKAETN